MLKKLLRVNDMNIPYKGGLGSYSLFLMILHINKYLEPAFPFKESYPSRLYTAFLSYFGKFNITQFLIDQGGKL